MTDPAPALAKIQLTVPRGLSETAVALLAGSFPSGVWEEEAAPGEGAVRLAVFAPSGEAETAVDQAISALTGLDCPGPNVPPGWPSRYVTIENLADQDWFSVWRRNFEPLRVGDVVVRPPWIENDEYPPGCARVIIDPGAAFGTGQHESTRLALLLLQESLREGKPGEMLDVGTGSGILALAALALGVPRALGVDIDSPALRSAGRNAVLNRMGDRFLRRQVDLRAWPGELARQFSLVTANLTAALVADCAGSLAGLVSPGGFLVVSGLYQGAAGSAEKRLVDCGLTRRECASEGEWCALLLVKEGG